MAHHPSITRAYGGIGRRTGFRYQRVTVGVQVPLRAPSSSCESSPIPERFLLCSIIIVWISLQQPRQLEFCSAQLLEGFELQHVISPDTFLCSTNIAGECQRRVKGRTVTIVAHGIHRLQRTTERSCAIATALRQPGGLISVYGAHRAVTAPSRASPEVAANADE